MNTRSKNKIEKVITDNTEIEIEVKTEIDLIEESLKKIEMAEKSFTIAPSDYDYLPRFNGNPGKVALFVADLKQIHKTVCAEGNKYREINENKLINVALSRLVDDAEFIKTEGPYENLNKLTETLEREFREAKSCPQLMLELLRSEIKKDEHPLEFLDRLEQKRTIIANRYRVDKPEESDILIKELDRNAVYLFIDNMPPNARTYLLNDNPKHLRDIKRAVQSQERALFKELKIINRETINVKRNYSRQNEPQKKQYPNYNDRYDHHRSPYSQRYDHQRPEHRYYYPSKYEHTSHKYNRSLPKYHGQDHRYSRDQRRDYREARRDKGDYPEKREKHPVHEIENDCSDTESDKEEKIYKLEKQLAELGKEKNFLGHTKSSKDLT